MKHEVVSHEEWTSARVELLRKEKQLLQLRDELSQEVRALPWRRLKTDYEFTGARGPVSLVELFGNKSQLIIYHFMFAEAAEAGCPSCSLVTDSLNPTANHLAARDVALALVSRARVAKLTAYKCCRPRPMMPV